MNTHHVVCVCHSPDHVIQFVKDPEDDTVYVQVQLHQFRSFWKRAYVGLRYVFGYECRYGHWDCTDIGPEEAARLKAFL